MTHLRVLSYNIHKGFNPSNTRYLLGEIRHAIRLVNADLVFLQEVVGENLKKQAKYDSWSPDTQFEFLADDIWPHFAYGKNAIYQHGHHGNAILSKHPFHHWENIDITRWKFSQRGVLHGTLTLNSGVAGKIEETKEPEQAPVGSEQVPAGSEQQNLHAYCAHFGLFSTERNFQAKRLINAINSKSHDAPVIIAGDLNDWHGKTHRRLMKTLDLKEVFVETHGKPARTFPSSFPLLRMDRIYYRGLTLVDATTLVDDHWRGLSDHCAIFAEFSC